MSEFKNFHPVVNFIYFVFIISFSVTVMHPACLMISFLSVTLYSFVFCDRKQVMSMLPYVVPLFLFTALINPVFNHEGVTILTYLPGGNPLTLESIIYGLCSACMIVNVILWFSVYSKIVTCDKFIYLFGKIIPSLSLILSMTMRFIPLFANRLKKVADAQKALGIDFSEGNIVKRIKKGLKILSVLITWSLENAVATADSMRSRGYGLPGRTAFSIFKFSVRDLNALMIICLLGIYVLSGCFLGSFDFLYFPYLESSSFSVYNVSVYSAYFLFCMIPFIVDTWEVRKWNVLRSKI